METRGPTLVVLCPPDGDRPPGMATVEERFRVRYVGPDGLAEALPGAEALFLWDFFSDVVRDAWPRADRLRWVHVAAAGVDRLLFPELVASDVVVTNARGVFDQPIAEYVLAMILAVAKDLPGTYARQAERRWEHRETRTVVGSTALVVGTGAIGRRIARVLRAVGMEVTGAGRTARRGDPDFGEVVPSGDLAAHVGRADHVVVVAPLTEQTRGLVDADVIAAMKPGSHLVNVGRGPIVDEEALLEALRSGHLAAASLDVFVTEPLPADSPLWSTPGVTVSPHMSGDALGWRETLAGQFSDNAARWLDGEPLVNVVDKEQGFVVAEPSREGSP